MGELYVSIIVGNRTEMLDSEFLRVENAFATEDEMKAYRLAIDSWLADIPTPVVEKTPVLQGFPAEHEVLMVTDKVDIMANRIVDIIKPRDPDTFPEGISYHDREADAAAIERRPYNGTTLEAGWES